MNALKKRIGSRPIIESNENGSNNGKDKKMSKNDSKNVVQPFFEVDIQLGSFLVPLCVCA
jgi:hypothetical protein